jgi:small-conductance mechanosensitive channel
VAAIGMRSTRIRTRDNRMVIVPNSSISSNQVVNYTYPDPRYRVQIEIGVAYGVDLKEVREIITKAVRANENVLEDKPVDVLFLEFGDSAMILRVRWWITSYVDTRRVFDQVNEAIYLALEKGGVEMPPQTFAVEIKQEHGEAQKGSNG